LVFAGVEKSFTLENESWRVVFIADDPAVAARTNVQGWKRSSLSAPMASFASPQFARKASAWNAMKQRDRANLEIAPWQHRIEAGAKCFHRSAESA